MWGADKAFTIANETSRRQIRISKLALGRRWTIKLDSTMYVKGRTSNLGDR